MADSHSFTPVQRRQCLTFASNRHGNENANWTATRCQRLLRPITSRIEALKKDSIRFNTTKAEPLSMLRPPTEAADAKSQLDLRSTATEDDDSEWAPEKKRVRIKRTYARSRATQEEIRTKKTRMRLAPGEFSIPTPMLSRITAPDRTKDFCSPKPEAPTKSKTWKYQQPRHTIKPGETHFEPAEVMRNLNRTASSTRFALYEGFYNALEALLKATDSKISEVEPKPRSLLTVCLKNVPRYIRLEEQWAASEAKGMEWKSTLDQQDIATEVYAELESLGTSEKGWKNLKVVVRAHGIHLVRDAIAQNLLDIEFASALVMLCTQMGCTDEAKLLLLSLLERRYPNPASIHTNVPDDRRMLPLTTLATFVKRTGNKGYQYRQLSNLVRGGMLPKSWLATKAFSPAWTSVFHSLSTDSPYQHDARTFLATVLPLLCIESCNEDGLSSALDATLASAIRTIASMCILHHTNKSNPDAVRSLGLGDLLRGIMIDCNQLSPAPAGIKISLIAISNLVIPAPGDLTVQGTLEAVTPLVQVIQQAASSPRNAEELTDYLSQFVCSIARCCGRCMTDHGFEHLRLMLERLQSLIAADVLDPMNVLCRTAVECGFAFSQQLPHRKHVHYAENLEAKLQGPPIQLRKSPARINSEYKSGFRWEEGISEWVTATPAMSLKKSKISRDFPSSDDDSEVESPHKIMLKHSKLSIVTSQRKTASGTRLPSCNRLSDLVPPSPDAYADEHEVSQSDSFWDADKDLNQSSIQSGTSRSRTRKPITKTRRFGHELLQSQQEWILFEDESDDELNSSMLSQPDLGTEVLAELPNPGRSSRQLETKHCTEKSRSRKITFDLTSDSEDELSVLNGVV